jgi:lipopolysaccharide transport system permease protein
LKQANPASFMNPHAEQPASLASMLRGAWVHRALIVQMTRREVIGRYKGSVMGLLWSFLHPLFMLAVYTFFFSVVFKARWGGQEESRAVFAVVLFAGMIVHALFADILVRSPGLVLANPNYVKKVVFPLETLVIISAGAALFHAAASAGVLMLVLLVLNGHLPWTIVFLPLVLAPLLMLGIGIGWMFASLGVFARDLGHVVGVIANVLLFVSPVFFPVQSLPEPIRPWVMLNPLSFIIEQTRAVLIWGQLPDLGGLALYFAIAVLVAWAGYAWFQKTRKGFADVL